MDSGTAKRMFLDVEDRDILTSVALSRKKSNARHHRRPKPLLMMRAGVSAVGCRPLLDLLLRLGATSVVRRRRARGRWTARGGLGLGRAACSPWPRTSARRQRRQR